MVALALALVSFAFAFELLAAVGWRPIESVAGVLRQTWLALCALLAGAALLDWFEPASRPLPQLRRRLPKNLALHDWAEVRLEIPGGEIPRDGLDLFDDTPQDASVDGLPIHVESPEGRAKGRVVAVHYRVRPMRRGDAHFGRVHLAAASRLGLWRFSALSGEPASVRVYPNFSAVARYGAIEKDHDTAQVGIRLRQRRGVGLEFHQLREYRAGDVARQVDWKATSRKQQLISRDYQDERDQRVVFLLDSSRRMRARDGDLSHFDHSLNAMVLASHVALRAGDAVGVMSFGDDPRWLPPMKGVNSVNRILNSVYDLEPTTVGSDFSRAAQELCSRQSRRSLVVLITNVRSEDAEGLLPGVALLKRRHLVLVANLREESIEEGLRAPVRSFDEALRVFGAWQHLQERMRVQETLRRSGVYALDAEPSQLHAQLVNSYLEIKRSGAL
jgi:uncharacterized protein (DUF58 family)